MTIFINFFVKKAVFRTKCSKSGQFCESKVLNPGSFMYSKYRGLDLYHQRYQNKKTVVLSLAPFSKVQRRGYEIFHVPIYAVGCLREVV